MSSQDDDSMEAYRSLLREPIDATVMQLLSLGRSIWGERRLTLTEIIVRLGVSVGDLSRVARWSEKDRGPDKREELEKEMGNVIFSFIRWCDDLGLDPKVCIWRAVHAQHAFARQNRSETLEEAPAGARLRWTEDGSPFFEGARHVDENRSEPRK